MIFLHVICVKLPETQLFNVVLKKFARNIGLVKTSNLKKLMILVQKISFSFFSFPLGFEKTNVPHTRYLYRMDTLKSEIRDLENIQKYA